MMNTGSGGGGERPIKNVHSDDDSLSSDDDDNDNNNNNRFGAKLVSQLGRVVVDVTSRRNSSGYNTSGGGGNYGRQHNNESLGQTLDADGCFLLRSSASSTDYYDGNSTTANNGGGGGTTASRKKGMNTTDNNNINDNNNKVNERYQEQTAGNLYGYIRSVRHTDQYNGDSSPGLNESDLDDSDDNSHFSMPRIGESDEEGNNSIHDDDDDDGGEDDNNNEQQLQNHHQHRMPRRIQPIQIASHSNNIDGQKHQQQQQRTNAERRGSGGLFAKLGLGQQDSIRDFGTGKLRTDHHATATRRVSNESSTSTTMNTAADPTTIATTTTTPSLEKQRRRNSNARNQRRGSSFSHGSQKSFRELQKRMKEHGAVTGNAVRAFMLQQHHDTTGNVSNRSLNVSSRSLEVQQQQQQEQEEHVTPAAMGVGGGGSGGGDDEISTGRSIDTGVSKDDSLGMDSVRGSMEKLLHHNSNNRRPPTQSRTNSASSCGSGGEMGTGGGRPPLQSNGSQTSLSLDDLEDKKSSSAGIFQGWKDSKNASWSSLLGGRAVVDTTPSTTTSTGFPSPLLATRLKRGDSSSTCDADVLKQQQQQQQKELDDRLANDPMFGGIHDEVKLPFVEMPSRERILQSLVDAMSSAADQGESCLLSVKGDKFVGKSRLVDEAIERVQSWGMGFTVLRSRRSETDSLTSFYPFREIVSAALHECDNSGEEPLDMCGWELDGDETDAAIVQRLIQRKILNKSDQLMLGRILPDVLNKELLSLLKGRNPTAIIKDIAASLFKLIIPLQPVIMLFEADGNGGDIDLSSWSLIEELIQSAGEQCPQMLMLTISRQSSSIPRSLEDASLEIGIESMTITDTGCFVHGLFADNDTDATMTIDPKIVQAIHTRANGCPLFTERAIAWAQRKRLIDVDQCTNFVDWNSPDDDIFPHTLNEEILEVINNLPEDQLDALKIATCLGSRFDLDVYDSLRGDGFHDSLEEVMASHGIFEKLDGNVCRWKNIAAFEAVESIIISNERREIHDLIASSLQQFSDTSSAQHLSDESRGYVLYARHHAMAKQWNEAFDLYMKAGKVAEKAIDFPGAVNLYRKAKSCLSRSKSTPSLKRKLSPHAALGACYRELIRYNEAEEELEFCLEQTMAVPEEDRDSAFKEVEIDVITTLATLKQAQSKYGEAIDLYERALPTARESKELQSNTLWLAHHVANCAEIYRKSGDLHKAATLHTEALGYREFAAKEHLCSSLELSLSFTQLGTTEAALGNYSEAYHLHKRALSVRVDQLDFYHGLVSESLNYCADALQALGRGKEGVSLGMHAVRIRKHIFGPNHPAYAHALRVLASCYHCIGRSYDSLGLMKECLDICEKAFSKNHANLIPNLMLYGSVLRAVGDEEARSVYERALTIHKLNFKGDQNIIQLQKLKDAIEELRISSNGKAPQAAVSLDMPIPSVHLESGMVHAIVCADFGRRASDEYMLSVASSLQQMGTLKLVALVAVTPPQVLRADLARGALDSLLLPNVPVAYSRNSTMANADSNAKCFKSDYGKSSPHVNNTGVELITRAMIASPDKSLVVMCTACLGDVAQVIETQGDLFVSKVKEVVLMGFAAKAVRRRSSIEPEESGIDADDELRRKVFKRCQERGIATVILGKEIALGFPFPSTFADDLATSNHMVSMQVQHREEMHYNGIWELVKLLQQEARGYRGSTKDVDIKTFQKYALGNKMPPTTQHNIWPLIKSINLELVLGLLCCIPMYRDYFKWESHSRGGVDHKISRYTSATSGIIKPDHLASEIHMLIGVALRTALNNTSC
ncbi:hypothetical protein ACHAWC_009516 [Mediolabrus comicus]